MINKPIRFVTATLIWVAFQFCQKWSLAGQFRLDILLLLAQIYPQMDFIFSKVKYGSSIPFKHRHKKTIEKFSRPTSAPVQKVLASLYAVQMKDTAKMAEQLQQCNSQLNPQWREQTSLASPANFPDFLLLGVPKSGTTTLSSLLEKHPSLAKPFTKELYFWGQFLFANGTDWYQSAFLRKNATASFQTYECTPNYFSDPAALKQIAQYMPDKKFIVILRDPALRARSSYYFFRKSGWNPAISFPEMVFVETSLMQNDLSMITSYDIHHVYQGLYSYWVQEWLKRIPRQQFLFIKFEQFISEPQKELQKISDFLGIQPFSIDSIPKVNPTKYKNQHQKDLPALQTLQVFYRKHNAGLAELIGDEFQW
jgi:hypothetical protein